MKLQSPGFAHGTALDAKYATVNVAGGKNVSPPLTWADEPPGTKSFALSVTDPHPVANNWIHWLVADIPARVHSLPEGASPEAMPGLSREFENSFGTTGYGGPQPPPGSGRHPYVFRLYALKVDHVAMPSDPGLALFEKALKPHVLAMAQLIGYFER